VLQDLPVAQMIVSGQRRPDLRRDGMIPVAMPSQVQLGLLPEGFDLWHWRITVDVM
jgi:hypothetical protein